MNNYLYDEHFLKELHQYHTQTIYARITALSWDESPLERVEGKITGGSINIDGKSAVRRTCSLTMVSNDVNIKNYYWGIQNKFKLEVGLENFFDSRYPNIIWFPQGVYVITNFNTSISVNNCTISIQGKDKMCLLNGDISGNLPSQVDFGIEEYYDVDAQVTYYNAIPLKTIIMNAVNVYGNEPIHNIVINDLDTVGLEQLRYRGEEPLYLIRNERTEIYENMTYDGNKKCYIKKYNEELKEFEFFDASLNSLEYNKDLPINSKKGDIIVFSKDDDREYTVFQATYGTEVGYRLTELTYAGELIANIGETLTSILDKIKNMLGNFEYFYDLDGHFVFQQQRTYVNNFWTNLRQEDSETYATDAVYTSSSVYNFNDLGYFTALTHNPILNNLKNDFSIWGVRRGIAGGEIPIHMRYAIDRKPIYYCNYQKTIFLSKDYIEFTKNGTKIHIQDIVDNYDNVKVVDWREIIYQMAFDYYNHHDEKDFFQKISENNKSYDINRYPSGYTGYEIYYIDIYSFWRDIYDLRVILADEAKKDYIYYKKDINNQYYKVDNAVQLKTSLEQDKIKFFEYVNGEYKEVQLQEGFNPATYEGDLSKFYIELEYDALGLRNFEQFLNQYLKFNEALEEDKEKFQYYLKKENLYVPCFLSDTEHLKWEEDRIYYVKLAEKKYIPYNFYEFVNNDTYYYPYNLNCDINTGWSYIVDEYPENLNFWFDFGGEQSAIDKYMVCNIGSRTKSINDSKITGIYFQKVPEVFYGTNQELEQIFKYEQKPAYTQIQLNTTLNSSFSISSQGKSAYDVLEQLLEENTYCIENITITSTPIYYLKPNTRIEIYDKESNIEGEYLITKITLPLAYNGTMSITASKAIDTIY